MTVREIIGTLSLFPQDRTVALLDIRKNLSGDDGEGSSAGCYGNFNIFEMGENDVPDGAKPWIAIEFENEDYDQDGKLLAIESMEERISDLREELKSTIKKYAK